MTKAAIAAAAAAWGVLLSYSLLSFSLADAGQGGLVLRIRKQCLEEGLAKQLSSSNVGAQLTDLVNARNMQPPPMPHFGHHPPPQPRVTVELPYPPGVAIAMRSNDSLEVRLALMFGVYFEQFFDASSKEVEIQVRKNFSAVISIHSHGFSVTRCSSCPGLLDIKTLYKPAGTLVDDVSPMVQMALRKGLLPVLNANACALFESALSTPAGSLLSPGLFDLSPLGIWYSVKSSHMKKDDLVLELRVRRTETESQSDPRIIHQWENLVRNSIDLDRRKRAFSLSYFRSSPEQVSAREGETEVGEEEDRASLWETLPSMHEAAVADIIMLERRMDWNFAHLLEEPFKSVIVDKNHSLGYCVLESIQPLLPVEISYEELENILVNVTVVGPARFFVESYGAYVKHPVNIVASNAKGAGSSTWTLTDVYSVPADISVEGNKLRISLSLNDAFLNMDTENYQARDLVDMLQKVLAMETPPPHLDQIQQEFPLPMVPDVGDMVAMKLDTRKHFLLISAIPVPDAFQSPASA